MFADFVDLHLCTGKCDYFVCMLLGLSAQIRSLCTQGDPCLKKVLPCSITIAPNTMAFYNGIAVFGAINTTVFFSG